MHATLNVWFILLSCVIAIVTVTVDGNNARSSVSNQTPVKQNTAQTIDAIKSLETTLGKKLDQLTAAVAFGQCGKRKMRPFFISLLPSLPKLIVLLYFILSRSSLCIM